MRGSKAREEKADKSEIEIFFPSLKIHKIVNIQFINNVQYKWKCCQGESPPPLDLDTQISASLSYTFSLKTDTKWPNYGSK